MEEIKSVYYLDITGQVTEGKVKSSCFINEFSGNEVREYRIKTIKVRVVDADYIFLEKAAVNTETTYVFSLRYDEDGVLSDITFTKNYEKFTVDEEADNFPQIGEKLYNRILEILSSIENNIKVILDTTQIVEMREEVGKEIKKFINYLNVYKISPDWKIIR